MPGGQAADQRDQAERQEVPAGRYGQQPADVVGGGRVDVLRGLRGDDRGGGQAEDERQQGGELGEERGAHHSAAGGGGRDVAGPVAEEGAEGDRVGEHDQRGADERRPEQRVGGRGEGAGVPGVEVAPEGEGAQDEQRRRRRHGDLVDQQHETESVDADDEHEDGEYGVRGAVRQLRLGDADEPVGAADERVTRGPHREREERDGGEQREERADDPAVHPQMRRGRDRVVRAVRRAEQCHGGQQQRAGDQAEDGRCETLQEGQSQQDGEGAEYAGREGVGATEGQPEEIDGPGRPLLVRYAFDAMGLDLGDGRRRILGHRQLPGGRQHGARGAVLEVQGT